MFDAYQQANLRYSQMAPLTMWDEVNTRTNLPAEIKIAAVDGDAYKFLFMAKGGGSANKSFLFQETKALLNPTSLFRFLDENLRKLGTAACPPYHLAVVIGGTSAESTLEMAKLASARYLDSLPREGSASRPRLPRRELESEVLELTRQFGIGAQFGGKYFCHDVRVIRLPRHGASCPVGIAVSCSARPPGPREDHRRRHLPRGARTRPGQVPARDRPTSTCPTTSCASTSTGRWTRSAPSCPATR